MRTGAAALVVAVAAALGTATGALVLPDRVTTASPSSTRSSSPAASPLEPATPSVSPTVTGSPAARTLGLAPVRSTNMLTTADLQMVGLDLEPQRADGRPEMSPCTDSGYQWKTLAEIAVSGPPVQREWSAGAVGVGEEAIAARDGEEATTIAKRILDMLETCQQRPPGYWLNGPTHTERLGPGTTVSWLGSIDGSLNKTGRAPKNAGISGGTAVLRRGAHVGVLQIGWCQSAGDSPACIEAEGDPEGQLASLSRAAALRLG